MRRLGFIIQKEFIQIFRNKAILPMMTVLPIVQLILLSYAANSEVKVVNLAIQDTDHSVFSQQLIGKIQAADRFFLIEAPLSDQHSDELMQSGEVDIVLKIPANFERDMLKYQEADLQILVNAINGQAATVGFGYLSQIIQDFNQHIRLEAAPEFAAAKVNPFPQIEIQSMNWFNPQLNFKHFMVPGILGELVTLLVMLLTAMNVVREREIGTIEQINVTPIRKWEFILGKMIPFLLIGLVLLTVGLIAGKLIFNVPMVGNLGVVFAFCVLNISAVLGLGLFISNLADTQQQAMFVTFFFAIIFILMSGLFTPIESMPDWAQLLTIPNPIAHFVSVMRGVLLKGSSFMDIIWHFRVMGIMAIVFNAMAVLSYRKVE